MPRRLMLGAFLHGADEPRHQSLAQPAEQLDLPAHIRLAQTLERGTFDTLIAADGAPQGHDPEVLRRTVRTVRGGHFEPLTLLAALSTVTERIGLVATADTTSQEPFHLARKFASLDHLSGGRAGWHLVTSAIWPGAGVPDLGATDPGISLDDSWRHRRAEELVDIVRGLWDSFADGAVVRDRARGIYYEPSGLRTLHHVGEHFTVRGPLNISRPPQGHPVLFAADSPEADRDVAERHGEVILTAQTSLAGARARYADIGRRAAAYGRGPGDVLVWPVLTPHVTSTEAEARARLEEMRGADGAGTRLGEVEGPQVAGAAFVGAAFVGTPEAVADQIERWFRAGAADGFAIAFPRLPDAAEDFVDQVVPELRRRSLLRTEYEETTLRGHLGLARPPIHPVNPAAVATGPAAR